MIRKIFKTGNSIVVSLPTDARERLGMQPGSEVEVEVDESEGVLIIRPVKQQATGITPEFASIVDEFIGEYRQVLEALA